MKKGDENNFEIKILIKVVCLSYDLKNKHN